MSKVISAEVSDELADRVDATRDGEPPDYDESRSQAVKALLRDGLEHRESRSKVPRWYLLALLGVLFVSGAFLDVTTQMGYVGVALLALSILDGNLGLLDRLT